MVVAKWVRMREVLRGKKTVNVQRPAKEPLPPPVTQTVTVTANQKDETDLV